MGRDARFLTSITASVEFQSTRPRGARRTRAARCATCARSFNPRARVGRDGEQLVGLVAVAVVSIHAPAWGATRDCVALAHRARWFQSTRPRGARPTQPPQGSRERCFNPRARVGRDKTQKPSFSRVEGFNPRARVGRDCPRLTWPLALTLFQSTRPRGARHGHRATRWLFLRFNPRARVGRDPRLRPGRRRQWGFNPRARVGRDPVDGDVFRVLEQFQSTRPRGARRKTARAQTDPWRFQSTRPRGARPHELNEVVHACTVSIHAPAWGATQKRRSAADFGIQVSIHAPAWGATAAALGETSNG